jgi:hypothetical protein
MHYSCPGKLEPAPILSREHIQRVVRISDILHLLDIFCWKSKKGILELRRVSHVKKLRCKTFGLVFRMKLIQHSAGKICDPQVAGRIIPSSRRLPNYKMCQ